MYTQLLTANKFRSKQDLHILSITLLFTTFIPYSPVLQCFLIPVLAACTTLVLLFSRQENPLAISKHNVLTFGLVAPVLCFELFKV